MEVILIKDVDKLGYANDIVDVRPGYANNYLIPQGLAKSATASARKIPRPRKDAFSDRSRRLTWPKPSKPRASRWIARASRWMQ